VPSVVACYSPARLANIERINGGC